MHKFEKKVFQFQIAIQLIYPFFLNHLHFTKYFFYFNLLSKVQNIINLREAIDSGKFAILIIILVTINLPSFFTDNTLLYSSSLINKLRN